MKFARFYLFSFTLLATLLGCNGSQTPTLPDTLIGKWQTSSATFEHFDHGGLEYTDSSGTRTGVWGLEPGDILMWGFKDGNDPWVKEYYEVQSWSENEFTFAPQGGGLSQVAVRK
ncbi:MAG: hypothetical protein H6581_22455 [Bacteroidia bacterium]|nr:hypothetical protein [Bacteroidia bacterium]